MINKLLVKGSSIRRGFKLKVDLEIELNLALGISGETGAGKTTLLRVIAGLDPKFQGRVQFGDEIWLDNINPKKIMLPTYKRHLGVVFQESRLLPGKSVLENLEYAERRASQSGLHVPRGEILEELSLKKLLTQPAESLSGGECQRVALGRALLTRPCLLLLDEPLSANDSHQRERIVDWLEHTLKARKAPLIYVSHSDEELRRLTQCLLLMREGHISRLGPTEKLLRDTEIGPYSGSEDLLDECNRLRGSVQAIDGAENTITIKVNNVSVENPRTLPEMGCSVTVVADQQKNSPTKSMLHPHTKKN